jgi:proteasome lid subunit RPN8/RPN11
MRLPEKIREAMVAHALFEYPLEACGLLASDPEGILRMCYCLTNADGSTTSFTVDPTEHFRAMQHAERNGWELTGVFHSHTTTHAVPSLIDRRKALEPDWLYVIVGLEHPERPEVRGFRIRDEKYIEEPLDVDH